MKRSPLVILFITVAIDLLGFGIILPLLPLYVKQFGGTAEVAGWLATSFSIMQFIFAPIWGRASDLYGRRPLILLSLIGSAVSFLTFGFANSLLLLFVGRIAAGILSAASLPTAQAYIADVTPPDKRAQGMALIGIAFGVGFALGPWIGAQLGSYGLQTPAFFVAGLSFVNFIVACFVLPESLPPDQRDAGQARKIVLFDRERFARVFANETLAELLTVFSVANFAFALLESTFTWLVLVRFLHMTAADGKLTDEMAKQAAPTVGPIFGIVGITLVIVQGVVVRGLSGRVAERTLVRAGSFILAGALFAIAVIFDLTWLKVASAFVALGNGILNPSLSSLVSQFADPKERGSVLGVQQSLGSLARMIAPPLGTFLLQRFGAGIPYVTAGVLMSIAFLLSLRLKPPTVTVPAEAPASFGH